MAQNVVKFIDVVPRVLTHSPLASGAGHTARKVKREFLPTQQTIFKYDTNDEIEFHISTSVDTLIPNETYVRFNLATIGAWSGNNDWARSLDEGGAGELFRRIELTDKAGRNIDVIEDYDRLSNIMMNIYKSPSHIASNEIVSGSYTQLGIGQVASETTASQWVEVSGIVATDITVAGNVTVTASLSGKIYVNDRIRFFDEEGRLEGEGSVTRLVGTNNFICTFYDASAAISAVSYTMFVLRPNGSAVLDTSITDLSGNTQGYDVNMRLNVGFFNISEDIPLFLMDGLIVKMFLREPRFAMIRKQGGGSNSTLDYQISKPRFVTSLRTPSQEVRSQYLQLYSEGNLNYTFPAYHHISRQESGSETNTIELDLPIAKSSVRRVVFTIQDVIARGNVSSAISQFSTYATSSKRFIDGKMTDYQFKVGGRDYPPLQVDCSDLVQSEAHTELLRTFNLHNNINSEMALANGFMKNKFSNANGVWKTAHKAIYSTSFATLENDPMSGLKTKGTGTDNHIICKIGLNGALDLEDGLGAELPSTRYFDFWFEYTKILHLSSSGIQALD